MTKILSWNVNGIRAAATKGFFEWLKAESPDILCLQETKAEPAQLSKDFFDVRANDNTEYYAFWSSAKKKGYSGVAIYSKRAPRLVRTLDIEEFDDEGRYIELDLGNIVVISAYFPNSQEAGARLDYKLRFCNAVLDRCNRLVEQNRHIVLSGDYNIAHTPIDLAHPKANEANPGYLPEEREWMTHFLSQGYADTFRRLHPDEAGHYSWWTYRSKARERDVGWRIDYHCTNEALFKHVIKAGIQKKVMGSDHCPVELHIDM